MERYLMRSVVRSAAFAVLVIVLAGCDGDNGGGPAAPLPGVPGISNLRAEFQGSCSGGAGTTLSETVDYRDSDGNVRGGTLQTTGRFEPSGTSIDLNFTVPSATATITGTTEGTINAVGCVRFGTQTAFNLSVALLDTAGNSSNILSARLSRPAGAPEAPRTGETGAGAFERLRP